MVVYGTIVFMQGADYNEFEDVLNDQGEDDALAYLCFWNYGEGYISEETKAPGNNWHENTYHDPENPDLFMVWSSRYQYVGLFERFKKED